MKTEVIYYQDAHQTEFTGTVLSCGKDEKSGNWLAVLDRTAFFPEQGGQKADRGVLGGRAVVDVRVKNDIITHVLGGPVEAGKEVSGSVDWARRFDFMQQHTGEHMLSGCVHARFGYDNVGFHLSEHETTLDFSGPITKEELLSLEDQVNRAIWADLPVKKSFPPEEVLKTLEYRSKLELTHDIRIVEIPGIDICACCAPHCDTTAQVGMMKITDVMNYKGGVRLHIACGQRALDDFRKKQENVQEISALLCTKQEETAAAVRRFMEKEAEEAGKLGALKRRILEMEAAALPSPEESRHALLFTDDADGNAMRHTVNGLMERYPGLCGVFCGSDAEGWRFTLGSGSIDLVKLMGELRKQGFKGGGKNPMVQGSTDLAAEKIREALICR